MFGVLAVMMTFVVGFFATAGAAGVDFGTNSRDKKDVQMGGLVGVALAIIVTAGISLLVVAGTYGSPDVQQSGGGGSAQDDSAEPDYLQTPGLITVLRHRSAGVIMFLLALAAFPAACFSAFIAANSFKTTLPKVNPFISVGIGTVVSIVLAVTGLAGKAIIVFRSSARRSARSAARCWWTTCWPAARGRSARGLQSGRLAGLAGGLCGGRSADLEHLSAPGRARRRLHCRRGGLFRVRQAGPAIAGHSDPRQAGGGGEVIRAASGPDDGAAPALYWTQCVRIAPFPEEFTTDGHGWTRMEGRSSSVSIGVNPWFNSLGCGG